MTSDTRPKQIAVEFKLGGKTVRIGGMCKGAGMIQPGMSQSGARPALHATMLCFLTTDAAIEARTLQAALNEAVAKSFNRITVDGDMSTNDTVLVLANGRAGNRAAARRARADLAVFQAALDHVTLELAKKIVLDGEGVSRFVTVRVSGARTIGRRRCRRARGGQQRAGQDQLVRRRSQLGPHPVRAWLFRGANRRRAESMSATACRAAGGYSIRSRAAGRRARPSRRFAGSRRRRAFDLHINLNLGTRRGVDVRRRLDGGYVDFNKGDVNDPTTLGG